MTDLSYVENQIQQVNSFQELVNTPFQGNVNAISWNRTLQGDFAEIVKQFKFADNMKTIHPEELLELQLSQQGQLAREILLNDLKMFEAHGAAPVLNLIKNYERDEEYPFFPTDVYSFHVDRAPIPADTYLCTYYGASSEIVTNHQATQKIRIPEIRSELKKLYDGEEGQGFEDFLTEYFFDLHYEAKPNAHITSLGLGHIWKLAIDYPESPVLPSIHRAPKEKNNENRLLLIC